MSDIRPELELLAQKVESNEVIIYKDSPGFKIVGKDFVFPYLSISFCLRGTARALYDMKEMTQKPNDIAVLFPGHIMHPVECSEDYTTLTLNISKQLFDDLKIHLFSHDYAKFHLHPSCSLTEEQVDKLVTIVRLLEIIARHTYTDLDHRRQMLVTQLVVGYEFLNYYRCEQDQVIGRNRQHILYAQFCDLVVMHYREAKDVEFYAEQLSIHPRRLNMVVRASAHGLTPKEWIEHYVVTQTKRMIEIRPNQSLKRTAFAMGFTEPSAFYRFFKRVAGITAKEFRARVKAEQKNTKIQ